MSRRRPRTYVAAVPGSTQVRPLSRLVLAQQAAYAIGEDAICGNEGVMWSKAEVGHRRAATEEAALQAASPAMKLCDACPFETRNQCAAWAEVEFYTGLAAGLAWVNGKPQSVAVVPRTPEPPKPEVRQTA